MMDWAVSPRVDQLLINYNSHPQKLYMVESIGQVPGACSSSGVGRSP